MVISWVSFSFLLFKNSLVFPVTQGKTILFPLTSWVVVSAKHFFEQKAPLERPGPQLTHGVLPRRTSDVTLSLGSAATARPHGLRGLDTKDIYCPQFWRAEAFQQAPAGRFWGALLLRAAGSFSRPASRGAARQGAEGRRSSLGR